MHCYTFFMHLPHGNKFVLYSVVSYYIVQTIGKCPFKTHALDPAWMLFRCKARFWSLFAYMCYFESTAVSERNPLARFYSHKSCLLPSFTVSCKMVLTRPDKRETCSYHFSLRLFTMVRRSSCGLIACWIFSQLLHLYLHPSLSRGGRWGALQMTSRPVFSIFLCSPLPSGTCRTPGLSIP